MDTAFAEHPTTVDTTDATIATAGPDQVDWPPLNANDRCDKCGDANVRAYVRVVYRTGDLLFCAHHFRRNEAKIRQFALHVFDESDQLTERKPTVGNGFA